VVTDLPCRFNPSDSSVGVRGGYLANSVAESENTEDPNLGNYPVFVDPLMDESDGEGFDQFNTEYWFVSDALKYLMATQPIGQDPAGNPYVTTPTFSSLDDILNAQYPPTPTGPFDPKTAQSADVMIRDYDASNKHVPEVMHELLSYSGFVMNWLIGQDTNNNPTTTLQLLRRDAAASAKPKLLYLAEEGTDELDPSENNTASFHLARDNNGMFNAIIIESHVAQIEATFYLAPMWIPFATDVNNLKQFWLSNLTNAVGDQRRFYRWYGVDECGRGYWHGIQQKWINGQGCDFSKIFPPESDGHPTYVKRYRPGAKTLLSVDGSGKPLKAILEINIGIQSSEPGPVEFFTNSGWFTIPHGWKLMDDRLGIIVTEEDPDTWSTGNPAINPGGGKIAGVRWQATPNAPGCQPFALRLTTVIDGDLGLGIDAPKRIASPSKYSRWRSVDARDHFQYCSVANNSLYYSQDGGNGTDDWVARDDSASAQTHANLVRTAHEFPKLAGSATIPFLTDYYCIGDRIKIINGRDAILQVNVGVDQGEIPTYPWVVAYSWILEQDGQKTVLQLSDRRAEPRNV
jgi:hypothetical protein